MKKNTKIRTLYFFLFFPIGIGIILFLYNLIVVLPIASRLQVAPNWDAIRNKLYYEFKPDMSLEEVHSILDSIGPWQADTHGNLRWDSDTGQYVFNEYIYFDEIHAKIFLGDWDFIYDKNGKLIRQGPMDYV